MKLKLPTMLPTLVMGFSVLITGCTSSPERADLQGKMVVVPSVPEYKEEATLVKLNDILDSTDLTNGQRARFLYERGVLFDAVGLRLLARVDFYQALKIDPQLADAYNFIGIYFTQEGEFENAYEAFDGVLDLAPNYEYAYLNRGIALHYGGRDKLAVDDLKTFYQLKPTDEYRALWLYLLQRELDPTLAMADLAVHRQKLDDKAWPTAIVDFYLGKISKTALFDAAKQNLSRPQEYSERLCEAYFYLAKWDIAVGKYDEAANYLRLALATNIYDFVEYRYARQELQKIPELKKIHEKSEH